MFKFKTPYNARASTFAKSDLASADRSGGKQNSKLNWNDAGEIKRDIKEILKILDFGHIDLSRIFCFRTSGSKSRSYARIWAMPKIFQRALNIKPAYVIEVLSRYFDKLNEDERKKVLIHELLHIPKNFSGALLPHRGRRRHLQSEVNKLFAQYKRLSNF